MSGDKWRVKKRRRAASLLQRKRTSITSIEAPVLASRECLLQDEKRPFADCQLWASCRHSLLWPRRAAHRQGYTLADICRTVVAAVGLVADDVRIWWLPYRADVTTPWIAAHCGGLGLGWVIRNP